MEVIYSTQRTEFVPGRQYRNPRFFQSPLGNPDRVIVVGNWPKIVEAYERAGVPVTVVDNPAMARSLADVGPAPDGLEDLIAQNGMSMRKVGYGSEVPVPVEDEDRVDGEPEAANAVHETDDNGPVHPEDMTDDELRAAITNKTGKAPHYRAGREKLLAAYAEAMGE